MRKGNHMKYEISGNKTRLLFSLLLVLMVILLVSCSSQSSQKTVGTVSYSADVAPIFSQKCTQCHGGSQPDAGLDLSTYSGVIAGAKGRAVIEPGNPSQSLLVSNVKSGKMPKRGSKLTSDQITIISNWVSQGALDN